MPNRIMIQNLKSIDPPCQQVSIIEMFRKSIGQSDDPEKIVDALTAINSYIVSIGDEIPYTIAQEIIHFCKLYSKRFDEQTRAIRQKRWSGKDAYVLEKYEELKMSIFYELKGLRKLDKDQKRSVQDLRSTILSYEGEKALYYYGGDKEMIAIRSITKLNEQEQILMSQLLAKMLGKGGIIILKAGGGFAIPGSQIRPVIGITLLNYTWKIVPKSQIGNLYSVYHGGEWFKEFVH